jgi:hypothetical protein
MGVLVLAHEMARDIALIEPNPADWVSWVIYFHRSVNKEEAMRQRRGFGSNSVLDSLVNELQENMRSK